MLGKGEWQHGCCTQQRGSKCIITVPLPKRFYTICVTLVRTANVSKPCPWTHEHPPWFFTRVINHQWGKNTPDTSIKNHTVVEGKPGPRAKPLQRKPHPTQKTIAITADVQRPHLSKRPRRRQDRKELRSPGRWPPNAPYSCHGYADRDSNATFPHGKHGPSQVLKNC